MGIIITKQELVIIGCGAGGGTAAQFARKTNRQASITIYEKGSYPQYSKCALPYVISGDIASPDDLIEFSKTWFQKANMDLHLNTIIKDIDVKKKVITGEYSDGSVFEKSYTDLIIATGSVPSIPPIKNIMDKKTLKKQIFNIRTLDDATAILHEIKHVKHATVVGAGLIGMEMADCLVEHKIQVAVVEALDQICPMLDADIVSLLASSIKDYITIFTNHFATEAVFTNDTLKSLIIEQRETKKQQHIPTDLLIIATGTTPETTIAQKAGCKIGKTGGICVNESSLTSQPHIYAVGDCTEYVDFVTQKPVQVGLGSIAVRQGIAAGVNAAGGTYTLPKGFLQTFTSTFFNQEIAAVGPAFSTLKSSEMVNGKYQGSSLPEYFPGGKPILMKIAVALESGSILSAQAIGANAAQRINTYATAMLADMRIDQLKKLETAYAPPIAPTLDTVTLVADIADMKRQRKKK